MKPLEGEILKWCVAFYFKLPEDLYKAHEKKESPQKNWGILAPESLQTSCVRQMNSRSYHKEQTE